MNTSLPLMSRVYRAFGWLAVWSVAAAFSLTASPVQAQESCVFDPSVKYYRTCHNRTHGGCAHYANPCKPADKCMYDTTQARYRTCFHQTTGGKCAHYASFCKPASSCLYNPQTRKHQSCLHVQEGKCVNWGSSCRP